MAIDEAALNKQLAEKPFLGGYSLSGDDASNFEAIGAKAPDANKFPHLARWYRNIASYETGERKAWGGATTSAAAGAKADDDEDIDLFGSDDEEDEEKAKVTAERLKAYADKKSKKPGPIAKSSIILDVKPWDDETNMEELEQLVRSIEQDGLVWGGGKLLPIGYGIRKLQIIVVVEDEKVSVDDIIEKCTSDFESHIQSVDIVAFNKI